MYRIDHKLDRGRFPNMPMRKDKLVRDYFGDQLFITTSGHFSTPALKCAMGEIGVQSIMFSIDYPFESIPNACGKSTPSVRVIASDIRIASLTRNNAIKAWWDEHVSTSVNQHDFTNMGRNNALAVLPRLMKAPHNLKPMTPQECKVGGLRDGNVCYGLYNKSWNRREIRAVP